MNERIIRAALNASGKFESIKCPINSKRFTPIFVLGQGANGTVFAAQDNLTGAHIAIKALTPTEISENQSQYRDLDAWQIMRKEASFRASRHVLPTMLQMDDNGAPFIVMPICQSSLASVLHESPDIDKRNAIARGYPSKERGYRYMLDIFQGMSELHHTHQKKHGDWKPENVLLDEQDRAILSDFGTSSLINHNSKSPRDNMGSIHTRAPECFFKDSNLTILSDIYGATALAFRIETGEYPLEREYLGITDLSNLVQAEERIRELFKTKGKEGIESLIWARIKKLAAEEFRDFYREGLKFDPSSRFQDSDIALRELNDGIRKTTIQYKIQQQTKTTLLNWGVPLFILGTLTFGGFLKKYNTNLPPKPSLQGPLYSPLSLDEKVEEIESEDLALPSIPPLSPEKQKELDQTIGLLTSDNTTAYFLTQYLRAAENISLDPSQVLTQTQLKIWSAHCSDEEKNNTHSSYLANYLKIAKNIQLAYHQARTPKGSIDLEDLCAIARLGLERVNLARRASGSFDFGKYITAEVEGKPIIEPAEKEFIFYWLANIKTYASETPKH